MAAGAAEPSDATDSRRVLPRRDPGRSMTTHTEPTAIDADVPAEPDYRFTLANERTFLAWIRTSFGLLAGGVAVDHLLSPFASAAANTVVSVGCLLLAIVLAAGAFLRW